MTAWNPWHGCHKISPGCRHCYVFREDAARGIPVPTTDIHKTSSFSLPLIKDRHHNWKFPAGSEFALCFTSDFLIEEADLWRPDIWEIIRIRQDCRFLFFTKRIDRLCDLLPDFWDEIAGNIMIGCTVENQDRADHRLPIFLSLPIRHRLIVVSPMLERIDITPWLDPRAIEEVTVGGESGKYARPLHFDWVLDMRRQCMEAKVRFSFHQTGTRLIKDGHIYTIPRNMQHAQAKKAAINFIP